MKASQSLISRLPISDSAEEEIVKHVDLSLADTDGLLREAVSAAWQDAVRRHPPLTLLGTSSNSLRDLMGRVVEEAISRGEVDLNELKQAAMEVVPKLRRPNGQSS